MKRFFIVAVFFSLFSFSSDNAVACPDYREFGKNIPAMAIDFFLPKEYTVIAGGTENINECASVSGVGWVTTSPDFSFEIKETSQIELEFRVSANCDTILLLNDNIGRWHFNDDFEGLDPLIFLNEPGDGWYDVWIGTVQGDFCEALLTVESF